MFLSCRPFVVITTLSTGLVGVEVISVSPSQETEVTSTPTRPVDNVVITTKGLQDRNKNIITGTTVENKGKLILANSCSYSVQTLLSSRLLSKNFKIEIYKTIILPAVLYGCET